MLNKCVCNDVWVFLMTCGRIYITKTVIFISIEVVIIYTISEILNNHNMYILSVINYLYKTFVEEFMKWFF